MNKTRSRSSWNHPALWKFSGLRQSFLIFCPSKIFWGIFDTIVWCACEQRQYEKNTQIGFSCYHKGDGLKGKAELTRHPLEQNGAPRSGCLTFDGREERKPRKSWIQTNRMLKGTFKEVVLATVLSIHICTVRLHLWSEKLTQLRLELAGSSTGPVKEGQPQRYH